MQPDALAEIVVEALRPLVARIKALEGRADPAAETIALLRERIAVLETRAPVPGPAGAPGRDGTNGIDGLGFGDLAVAHDGERAFTFTASRDGQTKDLGTFALPALIDRGVWQRRELPYAAGDVVSYAGSAWVCQKATQTQPETASGAGFWRLMVKRGKDGGAK